MMPFLAALLAAGRRRVLSAILLSVGCAWAEGVGLLALAPVLAVVGVGAPGGTLGALAAGAGAWPLPAVMALWVAVVITHSALGAARDRLILVLQQSVADRRRSELSAAAVGMEWRSFARQRSSDLTAALTVAPLRIQVCAAGVFNAAARLCLLASHAAVALWVAPGAAALTLAGGLALMAIRLRSVRSALSRGSQMGQGIRLLQARVEENLAAMRLIKSWGLASRVEEEFNALLENESRLHREARDRQNREAVMARSAVAAIAALGIGVAVEGLGLTGAPLLMLAAILARVLPSAADLARLVNQIAETLPAWTETDSLLMNFKADAEDEAFGTLASPAGDIVLRKVRFTWPGRQEPALAEIDVAIERGLITALTGRSGAGKTTLADVVLGLLPPEAGSVEVGGQPLVGTVRGSWRRSCAYVPQETFLFHASVRDNLRWGRPDAGDDALWVALAAAQAAELVRGLPEGLDTVVGDRGMRLSGGERQRLALARALVREPLFLVLDEATSAVDDESEKKILAALEGLRGRLTILVIAHRLSTVRIADRVLALQDGRLSDRGPPQ